MPDVIYVFELKKTGSAQDALSRINDRGYAIPYQSDVRKVVKVGVVFNVETRTIDNWQVEA